MTLRERFHYIKGDVSGLVALLAVAAVAVAFLATRALPGEPTGYPYRPGRSPAWVLQPQAHPTVTQGTGRPVTP